MSFGAERLKNVSDAVFYPVTHTGCVFVNWHGETDFSTGSDGKTYKEKYVAIMSDYETDWIQKNTGHSVQGTFDYVNNYKQTSEYKAWNTESYQINQSYQPCVIKSFADAVKITQNPTIKQLGTVTDDKSKKRFSNLLGNLYSEDFTILSYTDSNGIDVFQYTIGDNPSKDYTGSNFSYIILPVDYHPETLPDSGLWYNFSVHYCGYSSTGTYTESYQHGQFNVGVYGQNSLGAHNATYRTLDSNNAAIVFWGIKSESKDSYTGASSVDKSSTVWEEIATIPLTKITT